MGRCRGVAPVSRDRLLLVNQVHGRVVAIARRGETGAWIRTGSRRDRDRRSVDRHRGANRGLRPVLLYDPTHRVAGAVHAGWRGAASGIVVAAVNAMGDAFGSRPADLLAAIGPCLGQCCGEVGPDVVAAFSAAFAAPARHWFAPGVGDRSFLDLERAERDQLGFMDLQESRIFSSGLCTKTAHRRLHSYRAEKGNAGRMLAAIRLG